MSTKEFSPCIYCFVVKDITEPYPVVDGFVYWRKEWNCPHCEENSIEYVINVFEEQSMKLREEAKTNKNIPIVIKPNEDSFAICKTNFPHPTKVDWSIYRIVWRNDDDTLCATEMEIPNYVLRLPNHMRKILCEVSYKSNNPNIKNKNILNC